MFLFFFDDKFFRTVEPLSRFITRWQPQSRNARGFYYFPQIKTLSLQKQWHSRKGNSGLFFVETLVSICLKIRNSFCVYYALFSYDVVILMVRLTLKDVWINRFLHITKLGKRIIYIINKIGVSALLDLVHPS